MLKCDHSSKTEIILKVPISITVNFGGTKKHLTLKKYHGCEP